MDQPSSRRCLVAAAAAVSSLMLAATVVAPVVAGAATHKHRTNSNGVVVRLETSKKYGKILADSSGRTLYLLAGRGSTSPACKGTCASIWPPLLTKAKPRAGEGITAKMLGTVKRGSSRQVTYDGHALYLYAADGSAGQVNGEGIKSFGGTWYVLDGKGSPIKATLASSNSSGSSGGGSGSGGW